MPQILDHGAISQDELRDFERIEFTPKQDAFIFSDKRFCGYGGGVGNGKSFAGCIIVHNVAQDNPGSLILVGRRHATDLRDSTRLDFLTMFGDHGVFKEKDNKFIYPNGSEIIFRHLDDLRTLTNINLNFFWIDQAEEVPFEAFQYLRGRIRRQKGLTGKPIHIRGGRITYNMEGHNWIYYLFNLRVDPKEKETVDNPHDYANITATSMENPYTPDDYKADLMSAPKEWRDRFVYGSWDDFSGQIFSEWRPGIHVIEPFTIPPHWERFRSIDHGQNNPTACLWCAVDYDGNIYVYQEYYQEKATVSHHVKMINDMSMIPTTGGSKIMDSYSYTLIDPSVHAKTREKGGVLYSVADEYLDAGIHTIKAQNDVLAGINRAKEYMTIDPSRYHPRRTNPDGSPMKGSPRLFLLRGRCPNLENEIPGYKWKPLKYGVDENNKEQPVKKDDHATDALRYAIMSRPEVPKNYRQFDKRLLGDPLALSRLAGQHGMTSQEFLLQQVSGANRTTISHSESGVSHSSSDISHSGIDWYND